MKIFFTIILALASPALLAMTPERFSKNAGPLCKEYPNQAICKKWRANQAANTEADASQPEPPVTDSVTLINDKWRWLEVPGSAMDSVHKPEIDEQWDYSGGAANSWRMIQTAWSGAAVGGNRMYLTGGGHADGAHNGVLAVDINGNWERITEPSPIWTKDTCPNRLCTTVHGECKLGTCTTGPDGAPVAVHSYNGLALDGDYLYRSGGSIWRHGNSGVGPRNFRLNLNSGQWSTFPESGWESTMSNLVHVEGKLYLMTRKGIGIYDISTEKWERRRGAQVFSANTRMVYDKRSDRFYVFGDNRAAWVKREKFGMEWHKISGLPASLVDTKRLGVAKHDGLFLFWISGADLVSYDPINDEWGRISPIGTPGEGIPAGPFGRFNVVDGRLVLVNGVSRNMFLLLAPGEAYTPPPRKKLSKPSVPLQNSGKRTVTSAASIGQLPNIELLANPYYDQPQPDILQRSCGPLDEWEVRDLRTDDQVKSQRKFRAGDRIIFNVHWKPEIYPSLRIKGLSCALVRGIKGPKGQLPRIRTVNMTGRAKKGQVMQGGLMIENLYISMYEAAERFGDVLSGDCIGMPNGSQFAIFRNIQVVGCQHHAFITSHAYPLYLEIAHSHFKYAKSHLAYIDSVAMAYIHDSSFESPGWGHALRCIAGKCLIRNVKVSNINLNGSIAAPRGKDIVGMHPLEVYNCGGPHLVKNVEINFYRSRENLGGSRASMFRTRDAKWGCDLAYHDGKQWYRLDYGSAEWLANKNWPERKLKYQDVTVNCLTDKNKTNSIGCYGIGTWGSHPIGKDDYRNALQRWLRKNQFQSWDAMIAALPEAPLPYPHDWYLWTASRLFPEQRKNWLRGQFLNKWPVQPHPRAPANLAVLELENVNINNAIGPFVGPSGQSKRYCWGTAKVDKNCFGTRAPEARISSGE